MCVFFRRGMSDSSACFLFSPSFLRSFSRSQSCCLFPHTQRFLRAALIFAAARGHYQLIDYFDCYLIPPLGRGAHMCKCSLSLSLSFFLLGPRLSLSFVRCRRFANVSYLPINLLQADTAAHLVLCASVSHFLSPAAAAAVLFTSAAAILRLWCCSSSKRRAGCLHLKQKRSKDLGTAPGGQGKSILLPTRTSSATMVCHHTHDHTCSTRATPPSNQRTNTNAICQPSFFSSPSPSSYSALGRGSNGFLHTLEFFRASSPFSRISMHTHLHTHTLAEEYSEHYQNNKGA